MSESESEPSGEVLDRDTITANEIANWLNTNGPEWVLKIEPLGEGTEHLGFIDGRFKLATDGEINNIALDYFSRLANRARRVDYVHRDDSPFAVDES
ncbi:hypothetical protein [Haloplanus sp.]|jgi:hypothetical protein|uniref:hypothetical protein n=1 Tax=Haloplanus sp. TaxID=1961696 RepID=UPI0026074187|nr:hypothetical protein [Haloplanus sp.]